jgi:hypothetical protein
MKQGMSGSHRNGACHGYIDGSNLAFHAGLRLRSRRTDFLQTMVSKLSGNICNLRERAPILNEEYVVATY